MVFGWKHLIGAICCGGAIGFGAAGVLEQNFLDATQWHLVNKDEPGWTYGRYPTRQACLDAQIQAAQASSVTVSQYEATASEPQTSGNATLNDQAAAAGQAAVGLAEEQAQLISTGFCMSAD